MGRNSKVFFGALMVLPICFWVLIIFRNSVNVPWFDDFDPFPDFLRSWINHPDLADRLKLLFQPNNEHRMVIGKLVTLLYFWVTGQLNFTYLHIAGACFTLGTLCLFWSSFRKSGLDWKYFLPVPFLLFQMQYHLIFLWAICGLQHQPVVFFVCLTMFLLGRNRYGLAILSGICATFAMSNGIFVWVAGGAIMLLRSNFRFLAIWCLVGAAAISFYFYGLSAQGNESSIDFLIKNPQLSFLGFFAFLGGLFDFFPEKSVFVRSVLPVIMGMIFMIWIVWWLTGLILPWIKNGFKPTFHTHSTVSISNKTEKGQRQLEEFLFGVLVFLLVNALIIALLRPRFGFNVMIVSNYKIYPALFLIIAYLSFIASGITVRFREIGFSLALLTSIVIWGLSIHGYLPTIQDRRKSLLVNAYNQQYNGFGLGHIPHSAGAKYVDQLMQEMTRSGVYTYPHDENFLINGIKVIQDSDRLKKEVRAEIKDGLVLVTDPNAEVNFDRDQGSYAFARDKSRLYVFKLVQYKYSGRNIFRQYDKGSAVEIPFTSLLPGTYELGFVEVNPSKTIAGGLLRTVTIP